MIPYKNENEMLLKVNKINIDKVKYKLWRLKWIKLKYIKS